MPKTKKKFDWEIYDENDEFIDIISMTRPKMEEYQRLFPRYTITQLGYTDNGRNN